VVINKFSQWVQWRVNRQNGENNGEAIMQVKQTM